MNPNERKKTAVIVRYLNESSSPDDWTYIASITGETDLIYNHPRLLRSLSFGDNDYGMCVAEVLDKIFSGSPQMIDEIIDHFDIETWYEQKDPAKYAKIFLGSPIPRPSFWTDAYLRVFVSHLSSSKKTVSDLKRALSKWGMTAFIAHEDIEPTREWQREIEAALDTMDVMIAVVQPGFRESNWCCQEVGFAMGRKVDVIPLRAGLDPFGLFGKYQGIQAKTKYPSEIAEHVAALLLKRPRYKRTLTSALSKALAILESAEKLARVRKLDSWSLMTEQDLKNLLETISLSEDDKTELSDLITRTGAFQPTVPASPTDDMPF